MWQQTDVAGLLQDSRIEAVFCNGAKSWELYHRYCEKACQREAGKLPSTSPANAAWSPERLIKAGARRFCLMLALAGKDK